MGLRVWDVLEKARPRWPGRDRTEGQGNTGSLGQRSHKGGCIFVMQVSKLVEGTSRWEGSLTWTRAPVSDTTWVPRVGHAGGARPLLGGETRAETLETLAFPLISLDTQNCLHPNMEGKENIPQT